MKATTQVQLRRSLACKRDAHGRTHDECLRDWKEKHPRRRQSTADPRKRTWHPIPLEGLACQRKIDRLVGRCKSRITVEAADITNRVDEDAGRYSSRCTYRKIHHRILIRCCATLSRFGGSALLFRADSDDGPITRFIEAPRGYSWKVDENGVALQSKSVKSADYHPNAGELLQGPSRIRSLLLANKRRRWKNEQGRRRAANLAKGFGFPEPATTPEMADLVTLQDSILAGNCRQGSKRFAERLGVDADECYASIPAGIVLRTANASAKRAAAIAALRETLITI